MCGEPRPNAISLARLTPHTVDDLEVEAIALEPVDVVHLTTLVDNLSDMLHFAPIVPPTVDALADLAPDVVVPAHCTGWDAAQAIAARLPDAFLQNSVGTRFELDARP
jgi:7,8-dihydropterin-6-yl-methyl-4-(beta-D-ribofuranosyl)aminobenzene 5'-phosphate synthase